jgi:hypothetical protein
VFKLTTVGGRATVTRQFGRAAVGRIRGAGRAHDSLSFTYANEWEEYSVDGRGAQGSVGVLVAAGGPAA